MPNTDNVFSEKILIKGANVHNLKNVDLAIKREQLVVVTGLSGSGKSSLAFDTLYAEGQRRYVESLSSYARQFLGRVHKPEVEYIKGLPPAIAIEQKVVSRNPRSTVGTSSEIYDYLKLLFARIGETYSPVSNKKVTKHSVTDVVNYILSFQENTKIIILAPIFYENRENGIERTLQNFANEGFSRIKKGEDILKIQDINFEELNTKEGKIDLLIDRLKVKNEEDTISRIADSVQTAFFEGKGNCCVLVYENEKVFEQKFSNLFEEDGILFEEPTVHLFSFNNPLGACPTCEGFGKVMGVDENLVIPDRSLSVYEDAIVCWRGEKMSLWKKQLIRTASKFDFPIHRPYFQLSAKERKLIWTGNKHFEGINQFFEMLESESYKIQNRVMLSRYKGKTICPDCNGSRLRKEASYVKVGGKTIQDLVEISIDELYKFSQNLELSEHQAIIAKRLLIEINSRLNFLIDVGLNYLTLNRLSASLSGGESQRINLATSLGSSLVGSLYILDEPSIGLHSIDTNRLIKVLKQLRDLGNTVVIVEHDEDIMRAADEIIDIGLLAGIHGGEVIFQGEIDDLEKEKESLTALYLTGKKSIEIPKNRRKWNSYIEIKKATENNLKGIDVKFPLFVMTAVTGVSGSGKSSLVRDCLFQIINKHINGFDATGNIKNKIAGDFHLIENIEFVNQNPIGKSSRSNPVTYIKAYDEIRKLYAEQPFAKSNNFKAGHFSFNVAGGRCEECQGEGEIKVEMQFMADVHLTCDICEGKRFRDEILNVLYREKSIFDILEMSVDEAIEFFGIMSGKLEKKITEKLQLLSDVGLGYVKLGQSSSTLSGGESQRIKLASFLGKEKDKTHNLFIFDEPTTGLHFHDVAKLLKAFNALLEKGNTIIVIEHNLDVVKCADWVIDLGPEGGNNGGEIVCEGTPEKIADCSNSHTGNFLKEKM